MRKYFLYLVCVLLLVSACISERAKEDAKAGKKEVNESVAESVPKATMILWIDYDRRGTSAQGKSLLNVKAKVNIQPDGSVQVLEYVDEPSVVVESYIRKTLRRYRVKQKFLEEESVRPGV
ncbi:DUF4891 domain-containing protein [Phocaeicola coprophilus]|uniref:DUF4891 domain-containing protein n=1 Tax=Phocaeicola coprophilus TaxID=387090 RepID=UPI001DB30F87|nr:DUF4891 domain-containing protein [Phocaeicola coprophilus]HJE48050.1 DUF4891 domain-containing protein [Phocaeicola coprophilus]